MINTHFATGTTPVNQNIHWQTLALLLEQLQKSKYSLANTRIATETAPKIKTFIGKYSLL
ncbi:hypothetical protein [Tenacibaculum finnmarkense]|uniref:hypothetical protein n=1 Tax=Tenacibaculum finnmarkense TaxID=2781243 RepID=UPI000C7D901D|nr:hypothetical protein [Tenacibaculum finnmarkense]